jgi:hypothetical protein
MIKRVAARFLVFFMASGCLAAAAFATPASLFSHEYAFAENLEPEGEAGAGAKALAPEEMPGMAGTSGSVPEAGERLRGFMDSWTENDIMDVTFHINNRKELLLYRDSVVMGKDGDAWYVDPPSLENPMELAANNPQPTPMPVTTPIPTRPRMTVTPQPEPDTLLYYNPDGGKLYHLDPNCPSVHPKYLPLKDSFPYSELNSHMRKLAPCAICRPPYEPFAETDTTASHPEVEERLCDFIGLWSENEYVDPDSPRSATEAAANDVQPTQAPVPTCKVWTWADFQFDIDNPVAVDGGKPSVRLYFEP